VLVALLSVAAVAAAESARGAKFTLIGDSVADAMQHNPTAIATLNTGFTLDLQTRGCRRLTTQGCTIVGSSGPPPNVLQLVKRLSHRIGKIVVVDVGYNDTPAHYNHDLDTVMRALQDEGVKLVVWLTLRDPKHVYQASNADIHREPKEWPQFVIADWDAYSANHPEWFVADGIHPTRDVGATELAQFIHSELVRYAPKYAR
jgi:hypothetical protein